jgi:hypothetical protein
MNAMVLFTPHSWNLCPLLCYVYCDVARCDADGDRSFQGAVGRVCVLCYVYVYVCVFTTAFDRYGRPTSPSVVLSRHRLLCTFHGLTASFHDALHLYPL